jgi:hypothetical protein
MLQTAHPQVLKCLVIGSYNITESYPSDQEVEADLFVYLYLMAALQRYQGENYVT